MYSTPNVDVFGVISDPKISLQIFRNLNSIFWSYIWGEMSEKGGGGSFPIDDDAPYEPAHIFHIVDVLGKEVALHLFKLDHDDDDNHKDNDD